MGKGGEAAAATTNKYSWQQVKEHCTPDDAWVVYNNKVYDVSNWHDHPGGGVIFTHAGDDMTDIFAAFHAPGSQNVMARFYKGDLDASTNTTKTERQIGFERGYRDLRGKLVVMGMFKSNPWFYAYKCVSNQALWATACAILWCSENTAAHFAAAVLMGLFFQQCGWLAHDFLHHQVFKNRRYGDLGGIYWGNLMQGCK
jgi:predicted heme/steroid binding protein